METNHSINNIRIAFIHGRPQGHPIHASYAKALGAEFFYEDQLLRWHDVRRASKLRRYLSWILNALFFPDKRKYAIYLTECVRIPQFLMKASGLMRPHQKLITLLADESLYFVDSGRYSDVTTRLVISFLKKTDALICIGDFQTALAKKILDNTHHSKIYRVFNGVPEKIYERFRVATYSSQSKNILFVGHAQVEWRIWYKGIDLMIEAFSKAHKNDNQLRFILVGDINVALLETALNGCEAATRKAIIFAGRQSEILPYVKDSALYLHCSRGDAFPTAVLEALAGGVVPLISTVTGTSEVVRNVDPKLIVPLNSSEIADHIGWFFGLDDNSRIGLSLKCRQVIREYTDQRALSHFRNTFDEIVNSLNHQSKRH